LIRRLRLPRDAESDLHSLAALREASDEIRDATQASAVYRLLHTHSPRALQVARLAADDPRVRANVEWFTRELRDVKPSVGGAFLQSLGLRPGPAYGRVLSALRDALLDGEVQPGPAEEAFVRELLAKGNSLITDN